MSRTRSGLPPSVSAGASQAMYRSQRPATRMADARSPSSSYGLSNVSIQCSTIKLRHGDSLLDPVIDEAGTWGLLTLSLGILGKMPSKDVGKMSNFLDRCLSGDALIEDIDDYIDDWHQSDSDQSLPEFLGMTRNEYRLWGKDPNCLPYIVSARVQGHELTDSSGRRDELAFAARSYPRSYSSRHRSLYARNCEDEDVNQWYYRLREQSVQRQARCERNSLFLRAAAQRPRPLSKASWTQRFLCICP